MHYQQQDCRFTSDKSEIFKIKSFSIMRYQEHDMGKFLVSLVKNYFIKDIFTLSFPKTINCELTN